MNAVSVLAGVLLVLALLAGVSTGGYFLFKYLGGILGMLDPQAATLAGLVSTVAILCAAIIAGGLKSASHDNPSLQNGSAGKAAIYQQLLGVSIESLGQRPASGRTKADGRVVDLEHQLALHGSPKVIGAYMELRRLIEGDNSPATEVSVALCSLVKEMRADLKKPSLVFREDDLLELLRQSNQ